MSLLYQILVNSHFARKYLFLIFECKVTIKINISSFSLKGHYFYIYVEDFEQNRANSAETFNKQFSE